MFIKRAKSRPSLRAREVEEDQTAGSPLAKSSYVPSTPDTPATPRAGEEDLSIDIDEEELGSVMDRKKKNKVKKKVNRLSFGGDEEQADITPFKPKKSLLSQQIKLPSTPSSSHSQITPVSSSIYSREYLTQLKASTPSRLPHPETLPSDDVDQDDISTTIQNKYRTSVMEDTTAGIPDEAAIASAKLKRQGAVEAEKFGANGEDYISLGNGQIAVHGGDKGPHPESRLMREEDEGDEGDEDLADYTEAHDRLHLGRNANKSAARRLKGEIGEMIADREADEEDDEESREWELAQIRRAAQWEDDVKPEKPMKEAYKPTPIPNARPIPTIPPVQARLAKSLADLEITKSADEKSLELSARELAFLEQQEQELRQEVERVEGKREWVEEFRGWVEMLGGFLEEKAPKLEDIEADWLHHLKERATLINTRRADDDSDDLALFLGVPPAPEIIEVDDLGRSRGNDTGPYAPTRRSRREARIARRNRRYNPSRADDEGFSTDSSLSPGDDEDFRSASVELEQRVKHLLADVKAEEFRDPEKGLAVRFGGWREKFEEEYGNAFGGLAMVQAWEFWARGEMIGWEPLRGSSSIDSFTWFHSLYRYSRPSIKREKNGEAEDDDMDIEEEPPLGIDGDLVSSMVSSMVVPLLTKSFDAGTYDPYSTSQTRKAIDLADVIADLTGKDSRKFTALLKSVLAVYHTHLLELSASINGLTSNDARPSPSFDPGSRIAMGRYTRRRMKLLKNMLVWRRQAPGEVGELAGRLVGEVLRPILGRSWEGGGKEMAMKVLAIAGNFLSPDLAKFLREGPTIRGY